MENIDEIKSSILKKFEEMLDAGLVSLQDGGKFSSSEIGKEIGKFINQELKDVRKPRGGGKKKSDDETDEKPEKKPRAPRKKKSDDGTDEKPEKKKRPPSAWNIYMKIKMAELKAENQENGIEKKPKEMMADIALLWKSEKANFKVPSDEEEPEED